MKQKDLDLLNHVMSPLRTDSITERIGRLQREIARGRAVYTQEELDRLQRRLGEYEEMLACLNRP